MTARSHDVRARIAVLVRAARARVGLARAVSDDHTPGVAAGLLRDALLLLVRARALDAGQSEPPFDEVASTWREFARAGGAPADGDAALALLETRDPLELDARPRAEVERMLRAAEAWCLWLEGAIEMRSLTYVKATRIGRALGVPLAIAFILYAIAKAIFAPPNLARGMPVSASALFPGTRAEGLVDGAHASSFGIHTAEGESPWVRVDLGGPAHVREVRVYNRADGWFEDCLPLVLEVSDDGQSYRELERRTSVFSHTDPWTVRPSGVTTRFVRLRKAGRGYVALGELEVYGRR